MNCKSWAVVYLSHHCISTTHPILTFIESFCALVFRTRCTTKLEKVHFAELSNEGPSSECQWHQEGSRMQPTTSQRATAYSDLRECFIASVAHSPYPTTRLEAWLRAWLQVGMFAIYCVLLLYLLLHRICHE